MNGGSGERGVHGVIMGCTAGWHLRDLQSGGTYGAAVPMGSVSLWGRCPYGVSVPMGFLSLWGPCPFGVPVPLGFLSLWGRRPHGRALTPLPTAEQPL